jgi:pimeloyl-ACP methyl ester carboxylesterase
LPAGKLAYHDLGDGRPLVFVHGVFLNANEWRAVAPPLAEDFRCLVPTLPFGGHRLPLEPEADLSPPGVADLLADFLDALELRDAVVVANDTGGAFTQIMLTRQPARVGAVVLTNCDAFERFLPPRFRYLQLLARLPGTAWLTGQILRVPLTWRLPITFGTLTKRPIERPIMRSYVDPLRAQAGTRRDLTKVLRGIDNRYTLEAAVRLKSFERPVLLAWAREDRNFPPSLGRRLEEALPRARMVTVEDSFSFVPEDQPDWLVEQIRAFLGDVAAAPEATGGAMS